MEKEERAREGESVTCETSLANGDVGFHASMLQKLHFCFPSNGSLAPVENIVSVWSLSPLPSPMAFFFVPQVWYLSGWVCYLQMENPKEQDEGEERTSSEENEEERRALWEAARSYLNSAKKVIQRKCEDCS